MRVVLWISLLVTAVSASSQDCAQAVPIEIRDQKTGLAIDNLPIQALQVRQAGTVLPILDLQPRHIKRLLLLIDESGSVAGNPAPAVRAVFKVFNEQLDKLPADLSVEYGLFDDKSIFSNRFASEAGELRRSITDVNDRFRNVGHGGTAIFDALHEALTRFEAPNSQDVILLFTDGEDGGSKRSPKQLEREFRGTGVRLFTILLTGHQPPPPPTKDAGFVTNLVKRTGGSVYEIDSTGPVWNFKESSRTAAEDVRRFWQQVVLSGYVLRFNPLANFKEDARIVLTTNPAVDRRLKDATLSYPDGLMPCTQTPQAAH